MTELEIINQNHLESFNNIFHVKPYTKVKINCIQCGKTKRGVNLTANPDETKWWICKKCEEEVEAKLECFNNDVNYNLSNSY